MILLTIFLILTLFLFLLFLLSWVGLLPTLLLLLVPAAAALGAYHLTLGQKHRMAAEKKARLETQLLNRLSIKRNDLACQKRWLNQLDKEDAARPQHLKTYQKLRREIALLESELAALRQEE